MSSASVRVKVVNNTGLPGTSDSFRASQTARCMDPTVLPVPAPPRTRTGPFQSRSTSLRWEGCRKTRQRARGSARMAPDQGRP